MDIKVRELIQDLRATMDGTLPEPKRDDFKVEDDAIYGGVAGVILPIDEFELAPGLLLRQTYAHLMAPYVMAFAKPASPRSPHPGPWAPVAGAGIDINAELRFERGAPRVGNFDRLNSVWFACAMLRLKLALPLQLVVLSDRALASVSQSVGRANLWPMEIGPRPLTAQPHKPSLASLTWVGEHLQSAALLMEDAAFNRALQTFDHAQSISSKGAGIVTAWASVEALLRPGSERITDRLSRALAALLETPGPARDRTFGQIVAAYKARGGAAHAGEVPETDGYLQTFHFARRAFIKAIESGAVPDIGALLDKWAARR